MDIFRSVLWDITLIPVAPAIEPADFDVRVRQPGTAFLHTAPYPTARKWRSHEYWRRALGDLLVVYQGVCSYSGSWTKANVGGVSSIEDSSVDHFIPKSTAPAQAYEWANVRLSRARLNHRKDNHTDVLDPFTLPNGWFTLDFRSFLVLPNPTLSNSNRRKVQKTIDRLGLNADNDYVQERLDVVQEYCLRKSTPATLDRFWPFIAREMRAQKFDTAFLPLMQTVFRTRAGHP